MNQLAVGRPRRVEEIRCETAHRPIQSMITHDAEDMRTIFAAATAKAPHLIVKAVISVPQYFYLWLARVRLPCRVCQALSKPAEHAQHYLWQLVSSSMKHVAIEVK